MTPEARHLLAALHAPESRENEVISRLSEQEWMDVLRLAVRQRVAPVLFATSDLPLPEASVEELRGYAERAAARVLRQQAALLSLAQAVEPPGVRLVALKGLHLGLAVYESPALREMGDIDVLVSPAEMALVQNAANDLGFRPVHAGVADHHLPPLVRDGIIIELHSHVDSRGDDRRAPMDEMWSRVVALPLGRNLWGFCPEDLLLHVAMHGIGAHVMELGLRTLCDVRALLNKFGDGLNPEYLHRQASLWRAERALDLALTLAEGALGCRVPPLLRRTPIDDEVIETALEHVFDRARPTSDSAASFIDADWATRMRIMQRRLLHPAGGPAFLRAVGLIRRHGPWLARTTLTTNAITNQALERRRKLRAWLNS